MDQCAAVIFEEKYNYVDHFVPLAALYSLPLIVEDPFIEEVILEQYPSITPHLVPPLKLPFVLTKHFKSIVSAFPQCVIRENFAFASQEFNKEIFSIWCPHGNSDKGRISGFMKLLKDEQHLLVYGQKMIDYIHEATEGNLPPYTPIGNFRHRYWRQNQPFFDALMDRTFPLDPNKKTVVYLPTWDDGENVSSYFHQCEQIVKELSSHYNLIVKPHPNLLEQDLKGISEELAENYPIFHAPKFLPIYPLLDRADIYLGDFSSVGYDFLSFNRPMFFLNMAKRDAATDQGLYIFQCGKEIDHTKKLLPQLEDSQEELKPLRKRVYDYTFTCKAESPHTHFLDKIKT